MFGVAFLYFGSLLFLFIVDVSPSGWGWTTKISWLGKLVSMFWCMELDFFSLECNGVSISEFLDGPMCLV